MITNNNSFYSGYSKVNKVEESGRKANIIVKIVGASVVVLIRNSVILRYMIM